MHIGSKLRLTVSRSMALFGALVIGGLLVVVLVGRYALVELKVGGPVFGRLMTQTRLLADTQPSSLALTDPYLTLLLLNQRKLKIEDAKSRLKAMEKTYQESRDGWKKVVLPPELHKEVVDGPIAIQDAFWKEVDTQYVPAFENHDISTKISSFVKINALFAREQEAVRALSVKADSYAARTASAAARRASLLNSAQIVSAIVILAMVLAGLVLMHRLVIRPIGVISGRMRTLADGDYETPVPYAARADEVGGMAKSAEVFRNALVDRQNVRQKIDDDRLATEREQARNAAEKERAEAERNRVVQALADGLSSLSRGDFAARIDEPFVDQYEVLRKDFNSALDALETMHETLAATTDTVRARADEISRSVGDLSQRTEEQAASIAETASALDEITATVRNASERSLEVTKLVGRTDRDAEQSLGVVTSAIAAMGTIQDSSARIGQIIGVIDEIAFQTNLLALNAGVEAARAGDAGRGFAVVAQEVRELAQRTTGAAKEIKALVDNSSREVESGAEFVDKTGEVLGGIRTNVAIMARESEAISTAQHEQAEGLQQVNIAINQMDQVTQQNAAMVEETTAACHDLMKEAGALAEIVARFNNSRLAARRDGAAIRPADGSERSTQSPARALGRKLAQAFTTAPARAAAGDDWTEF